MFRRIQQLMRNLRQRDYFLRINSRLPSYKRTKIRNSFALSHGWLSCIRFLSLGKWICYSKNTLSYIWYRVQYHSPATNWIPAQAGLTKKQLKRCLTWSADLWKTNKRSSAVWCPATRFNFSTISVMTEKKKLTLMRFHRRQAFTLGNIFTCNKTISDKK